MDFQCNEIVYLHGWIPCRVSYKAKGGRYWLCCAFTSNKKFREWVQQGTYRYVSHKQAATYVSSQSWDSSKISSAPDIQKEKPLEEPPAPQDIFHYTGTYQVLHHDKEDIIYGDFSDGDFALDWARRQWESQKYVVYRKDTMQQCFPDVKVVGYESIVVGECVRTPTKSSAWYYVVLPSLNIAFGEFKLLYGKYGCWTWAEERFPRSTFQCRSGDSLSGEVLHNLADYVSEYKYLPLQAMLK